ncbi:MAG: hypothetical protein NTW03_09645 [Verrucomicrobia bacterium]|nr:hypothetical protein [Verrucomicrobiota bacterium]
MSDPQEHSAPPSGSPSLAGPPPIIAPPIIPEAPAAMPKPAMVRRLFSWWVARVPIFIAVGLAAMLALLSTEEKWRTGRAWKKCRQDLEARGEKLDSSAFIPPPVPPEKNFVMTPLLTNTLAEKNPANPLDARLNHSKLNPTLGNWRMAKPVNLAIWSDYYRQGTNYPVAAQRQTPAADVVYALGKYDQALDELRAASQRPEAQFSVHWEADPNGLLLPHLAVVKGLSQTLALRAAALLAVDRAEDALGDLRVNWRLMDALKSEPIVLSFMVRVALNEIAIQPVWEGLAARHWNEAQLAALDKELARLDFMGDLVQTLRGERAYGNAMIDQMMQDRLPPEGFMGEAPGSPATSPKPKWYSRLFFPSWMYWRNQTLINRFEQEMIESLQQSARQPGLHPPLSPGMTNRWAQRLQKAGPLDALAKTLLPAVVRLPQQACRAQTIVNLARVGCALERFRLAHGVYPEKLSLLAPEFLASVPLDWYVGQPLHYRLREDGQILLYSVGANLRDDGGRMVTKDAGSAEAEKGDLVWAYSAP